MTFEQVIEQINKQMLLKLLYIQIWGNTDIFFSLVVGDIDISPSPLMSLFNQNHPLLEFASVLPLKSLKRGDQEPPVTSMKLCKKASYVSSPTQQTYSLATQQGEFRVILNEVKVKLDKDRSFQHLYVSQSWSAKNKEDFFRKPSLNSNMSFEYNNNTYYCKMSGKDMVDKCKEVVANVDVFRLYYYLLDTTKLWSLMLASEYSHIL